MRIDDDIKWKWRALELLSHVSVEALEVRIGVEDVFDRWISSLDGLQLKIRKLQIFIKRFLFIL